MRISFSSDIGRLLGLMSLLSLGSMLLLFFLFYNAFSQSFYDEKRHESRNLTGAALSIVESFHHLSRTNALNEHDAQALALHMLKKTRYGNSGYFWVNTPEGELIMHPLPGLEGQNIYDMQLAGQQVSLKGFVAATEKGADWVEYDWITPDDASKLSRKLSYIIRFEPWNWVLGSGIYLKETDQKRDDLFINSSKLITLTFVIIVMLSVYLARTSSAAIRELAVRDPLTRLFSRRYLEEVQAQFISRDERDKHHQLYLIFLDIDFFKRINDTYGHNVGDQVLKTLGSFLNRASRPDDLCIRYGGEEFLLIMFGQNDQHILDLVERLRNQVHQLILPENLSITLSAGVAKRLPQEDFTSLLNRADANLYQAKDQGRNCSVMR